ncbi:thioredoxin family protein [Patescibacteria group bacterium]|nr:thioredoxin family protein [Patescibacteria group bacterium]MBU1074873.1 thioredoxin family protein [Patescibacteria group bacterium]MBU1952214.1 thioredoxin family protein [Patescibacteria group bacterium]
MTLTHSKKNDLGLAIPDFSLPATDGNDYSISSFSDNKVLVIIFTCNHCPYAKFAKPKIVGLFEKTKSQDVQFIAINSNDADNYPEDSFENMKKDEYNYPFPYLHDVSQNIAKQFGAVCTPDIFVYDQERKLAYHGQLDDSRPGLGAVAINTMFNKKINNSNSTAIDLENAIEALLADQVPEKNQKPSIGCSIKWKEW